MLLIFDLDDTLIDTSGCITPVKLEDALVRMVEEGLSIPSFSDALEVLLRLDRCAESSKQALAEFLEINNADMKFLEIGVKEVYDNISSEIPVFPLNNTLEVLNELVRVHQLALVSVGRKQQQLEKMKKAGIDSSIFSKIIISEDRDKKPHYLAIVEEFDLVASDVIVCGDRVLRDLAPGRELGFKTVHMQWGRGLHCSGSKVDVDFTISNLIEIKEIIKNL